MMQSVKRTARRVYDRIQGLPLMTSAELDAASLITYVNKPNPVILEIGCNDGEQTLWFDSLFEMPQIYCFEPDPRAIKRFKANVRDLPNIHLYPVALSNSSGEAIFHQSHGQASDPERIAMMPDGWDLSGSLHKPKEHLDYYPWVKFDSTIRVKTLTLDQWYQESGLVQIDFIWMDVQGAELDVIQGGRQALAQTKFLYTEYSVRELYEGQATLKTLLKQLPEFAPLVRYPGDLLLKHK